MDQPIRIPERLFKRLHKLTSLSDIDRLASDIIEGWLDRGNQAKAQPAATPEKVEKQSAPQCVTLRDELERLWVIPVRSIDYIRENLDGGPTISIRGSWVSISGHEFERIEKVLRGQE